VTIAGQNINVQQAGGFPCVYTINPFAEPYPPPGELTPRE